MAYDEKLAARIGAIMEDWDCISKKMFGSIGWMLNGNLCVGIWKNDLIVRCDPADWPEMLEREHVREFDITGRSMRGWLLVDGEAVTSGRSLHVWLNRSRNFVQTLPAK